MSRKNLSCSFVNNVYDNYNKISYLQRNKKCYNNLKSLFRRKSTFHSNLYSKRLFLYISANVVKCCKLQLVFKNKTRLCNNFHFKDRISKNLTSGVVYNFQCRFYSQSYYGECVSTNELVNILVYQHLSKNKLKPHFQVGDNFRQLKDL